MKKILISIVALAMLTGCASPLRGSMGAISLDFKGPIYELTGLAIGAKTGEATCVSYAGIFSEGDCSVDTAAKNGGIKTVTGVDYKVKKILGFYVEYTTIAKGN